MNEYQETCLWKKTLGQESEGVIRLRDCYIKSRDNASYILDKIKEDFPELTMHDISHVDSLWSVANTIIGDEYKINPLEGFVIGCAFLIHDAALSYYAFGGKEGLRNNVTWKDIESKKKKDLRVEELDDDSKRECDFKTIRYLHADKCNDILGKEFVKNDGTKFYIIEDNELRERLGTTIEKIAASHHQSIDVIATFRSQLNAVSLNGISNNWIINEIKLACILRCSDAGHIDSRRAPLHLFRLIDLNHESYKHWRAQKFITQLSVNGNKLQVDCSNNTFEKEDFEAWNVAFDLVKVLDNEIISSNELLKDCSKNGENLAFPVEGVLGASSREQLSKYIKTKGWTPCDVNIHIDNVKRVVEGFGGENLYGTENQLLIVLRELIRA